MMLFVIIAFRYYNDIAFLGGTLGNFPVLFSVFAVLEVQYPH